MRSVAASVVVFLVWLLVVMVLTIHMLRLHRDVEAARARQVRVLGAASGGAPPDVSRFEAKVQAKHNEFNTVGILLVAALALGLIVFTIGAYRLAAAARDAREVMEFRALSGARTGLPLGEENAVSAEQSSALPPDDAATPQPALSGRLAPVPPDDEIAPTPVAPPDGVSAAPRKRPAPERAAPPIRSSVTLPPYAPAPQRTALDDVFESLAPPDTARRQRFDLLRHAGLRFPALPDTLGRLLDVVEQPRTYIHQLVREISHSPALAQKLIRLANTLLFSPPKPVQNLSIALVVLGADGLRSSVVAQGVHEAFDFSRSVQVELWHEAIATAVAATLVGRAVRFPNPTALHVLGLASRLGRMVLLHNRPEGYARLVDLHPNEHVAPHDVEQEAFGFTGAQVGAVALAVWRLPSWMQGAVMHAHDLAAPGLQRFGHEAVVAAAVLDAAGAISRAALGTATLAGAAAGALTTRASIPQLGLTQDQLEDVVQDLRDMADEQRSFL